MRASPRPWPTNGGGAVSKRTEVEDRLEAQLLEAGLVGFEREYQAIEGRRFKWDFAYVKDRLLIEVQGAVWVKGGHSTGVGITRDCEKVSLASVNKWFTIPVTTDHVKSGKALEWIKQFLTLNA